MISMTPFGHNLSIDVRSPSQRTGLFGIQRIETLDNEEDSRTHTQMARGS